MVVQDPVPGSYSSAAGWSGPAADLSSHKHRAVRQRRDRFVGRARPGQVPSSGPRFRWPGRTPERPSRGEPGPTTRTVPSTSSVAVDRVERGVHAGGGRPGPRGRVVQLGRACHGVALDVAARHEHHAVGQQDGRVAVALRGPATVWRSSSRCWGRTARSRHFPSRAPCRRAATWPCRGATRRPSSRSRSRSRVAGSYTSAPAIGSSASGSSTSPTSTLPSRSNVAGKPPRGLSMFPVADQVPLTGSYNSAEVSFSIAVGATHDQHPAIKEPHRGVAGAGRAHRAGGDPGACWSAANAVGFGAVALGVGLGATMLGRLGLGSALGVGLGPPGQHEERAADDEHGDHRRRAECGSERRTGSSTGGARPADGFDEPRPGWNRPPAPGGPPSRP